MKVSVGVTSTPVICRCEYWPWPFNWPFFGLASGTVYDRQLPDRASFSLGLENCGCSDYSRHKSVVASPRIVSDCTDISLHSEAQTLNWRKKTFLSIYYPQIKALTFTGKKNIIIKKISMYIAKTFKLGVFRTCGQLLSCSHLNQRSHTETKLFDW